MGLAALATKLITPTVFIASTLPTLDLSSIVPVQVGEWTEQKEMNAAVINPQSLELIKKIYTQTLSRTYINKRGERIMLSIAYGTDQRDGMQVHYPEVCYPAQGFQVTSNRLGVLATPSGSIPVKRLETNLFNQRYEPVTYWTTLGDQVVTTGLNKKMLEMGYGLRGKIPDGLLFRLSSIDTDSAHAFATQDSFVNALAGVLAPKDKSRLLGLH